MTRIHFVSAAFLAAAALVFGGCSADGTASDSPSDEPASDDKKSSSSSSKSPSSSGNDDNGHYTLPGSPTPTPATPDPGAAPPSSPADPGGQTPTTPAGPVQTSTCTSTNGANRSVTTLELTIDNGTVHIGKMTVAVTNKDGRNKNDVDVWLTPQGGSETKSFNSGDILPNAKVTEVPLPATFKPNTGTKIRIETNFDQAFSDPSASCIIQL